MSIRKKKRNNLSQSIIWFCYVFSCRARKQPPKIRSNGKCSFTNIDRSLLDFHISNEPMGRSSHVVFITATKLGLPIEGSTSTSPPIFSGILYQKRHRTSILRQSFRQILRWLILFLMICSVAVALLILPRGIILWINGCTIEYFHMVKKSLGGARNRKYNEDPRWIVWCITCRYRKNWV